MPLPPSTYAYRKGSTTTIGRASSPQLRTLRLLFTNQPLVSWQGNPRFVAKEI